MTKRLNYFLINEFHKKIPPQQKRDIEPMLVQCWSTAYDDGPTSLQCRVWQGTWRVNDTMFREAHLKKIHILCCSAKPKVITAYLESKQLQPFGFARQCSLAPLGTL